jgi:hypothetical protein
LFVFEGISGKFITAVLRPGKRPTGVENAAIIKRVLKHLRSAWPNTHIVLRGDGHFSNPELMQLAIDTPNTDFILGLAGNRILSPLAQPFLEATRGAHQKRCGFAQRQNQVQPSATRTYHDMPTLDRLDWVNK